MPDSNSILMTLSLKESNINFDDDYIELCTVKGVLSLVYSVHYLTTLRIYAPYVAVSS